MIFYYPLNAETVKDLSRFTYMTYASLSLNMNRLNNDSSNTFRILDVAAIEMLRCANDLPYMPSLALSSPDFVAIDRINRFNISQISCIDTVSSSFPQSSTTVKGYSVFSNKIYELANSNSFVDMSRHSLPVDIFLEDTGDVISHVDEEFTLTPNVEYKFNIPFKVNKSKITINILDTNIADILTIEDPYIIVTGTDLNYNIVSEEIYLNSAYDIISQNEYLDIKSIILIGLSSFITLNMLPYIKNRTAEIEFQHIDREDFFSERVVFSLDPIGKMLNISRLNDTNVYPPQLDTYESVELQITSGHTIVDYHMDGPNKLLYVITSDSLFNKYINIYPIIIPYYLTNIGSTNSTEEQNIKVEYIKDTVNRKYIITIFPANKMHGVEHLNISVISPYKVLRGKWAQSILYNIGDLVVFGSKEYICTAEHTSTSEFNLSNFTSQKEYIIQGFLLDLISFGVESNKFEISFDTLFKYDCEAILQIDTDGSSVCTLQMLMQNHKLSPIVYNSLNNLIKFNNKNLISDTALVLPVENMNNKILTNKLNNYDYFEIVNQDFTSIPVIVYSISSYQNIGVNNWNISNIFNTFYLDWESRTIITSDTITHILNTDSRNMSSYEFIANNVATFVSANLNSSNFKRNFF